MAHNNNQVRARYRPKSKNIIDQVREVIRYHHYGADTERIYVRWILEYIKFNGIRHPLEMGKEEIERFLIYLSINRKVTETTQKEAINAILFLYREVLDSPLDDQIQATTSENPSQLPSISNHSDTAPLYSKVG